MSISVVDSAKVYSERVSFVFSFSAGKKWLVLLAYSATKLATLTRMNIIIMWPTDRQVASLWYMILVCVVSVPPNSSVGKDKLILKVYLQSSCHPSRSPSQGEEMRQLVFAVLGLSLGLVSAFPSQQPENGKNWVVIVAGSNGWYNYRHQVRGVRQSQWTKLSHSVTKWRLNCAWLISFLFHG